LSGAVEADVEQCRVEAPTRRPERLHVDNTRTDGRDNDRERVVLVDESNAAIPQATVAAVRDVHTPDPADRSV
jgi:hypothetical protein